MKNINNNCLILSINPGSTSTKIALYRGEAEEFCTTLRHSDEELAPYPNVIDQYDFRKDLILDVLQKQGLELSELNAVVGRGGLFPHVKAGGYRVNQTMKNLVLEDKISPHASNIGCLIADAIAQPLDIPAYVYDCVSSDEMMDVARVTGIPEIVRTSFCHVLNSKAMSRKVAESQGKTYEEMNYIVAHLGGGISISAHRKGKIIDTIADDQGAFSPERAGSLPLLEMLELCYSGKYNKREAQQILRGNGGLKRHLGTSNCIEIERRIDQGDEHAALLYDAQAYQIAKAIGMLSPALCFDIDAIILTGGVAHSQRLTDRIRHYLGEFRPIIVAAGENEMESLSLGVLRILSGQETARDYVIPVDEI